MGWFDLFRRKPPATDASAPPVAPAGGRGFFRSKLAIDGDDPPPPTAPFGVRERDFTDFLRAQGRTPRGSLWYRHWPPFRCAEVSCDQAPDGHVVLTWDGRKVVEATVPEGFAALLRCVDGDTEPFDRLVRTAAEVLWLRVLESRDTAAALCEGRVGGSEVCAEPAPRVVLERFEPPHMDGERFVFLAERRRYQPERGEVFRVSVDRATLEVVAERIGPGPLVVSLPIPGRALVRSDGTTVTAEPLASPIAAARFWRRQALGEHASIAAFARATLELMEAGAPLELVQRTLEAALDEVEHARQCLAIARGIDGEDPAIGPLPPTPPRHGDPADIARRTLVEAAIPETMAAQELRASAARAREDVSSVLAQQAADEARHAELAWDTIAWCGGVRDLPPPPRLAPGAELDGGDAALGISSLAERNAAIDGAWATIQARRPSARPGHRGMISSGGGSPGGR